MKFVNIIFILIYINVNSQNLVRNQSFEIFTTCPTTHSQLYLVNDWMTPTGGTPDFYNICGASNYSIPTNISGNQYAIDGNSYVGIFTFGKTNSGLREYI